MLAVALVLSALAAALIPRIEISTSRYGLVSKDNPYQRRLLAFFERFGSPDTPVVVVTGGTPEKRRGAVDAIVAELEKDERFRSKVLARLGPRDVAEILLLQRPGALAELARQGEGDTLRPAVERGIVGLVTLATDLLYAGLEGEAPAPPGAEANMGQAFAVTTALVTDFDAYLAGGPSRPLTLPASFRASPAAAGLDEQGYLQTADGRAHVIQTVPELPGDDAAKDLAPVVDAVRSARDRALVGESPTVGADVTGLPALAVDELGYIAQGLYVSSLVATIGIVAFCLLFFRSLRKSIIALTPLGLGVIWTLGAVYLIYGQLNLITSSFVAVLLGLGIDFAVHLVSRANEGVRAGLDAPDAARMAVATTGPGIGVGAFVTAVAFLTTRTTEFTAYGELGVITAVGLLLIFLATLFVVPPLFVWLRAGSRAAPELWGLSHLTGAVRKAPGIWLAAGLAAGVAGIVAFPRIDFNSNYFRFLPDDAESARGLRTLEGDPILSPITANLVAEDFEEARALAERARALEVVGGVQSPSDFVPPLDDAGRKALAADLAALGGPDPLRFRPSDPDALARAVAGLIDAVDEVRFALKSAGRPTAGAEALSKALGSLRATLDRAGSDPAIVERLRRSEALLAEVAGRAHRALAEVVAHGGYGPYVVPERFRRRFVAKDGRAYAVYVTPRGDIWDRAVGRAFATAMAQLDEDAAGLGMNRYVHEEMIVGGFRRAAALAAGLIFLSLVLDFRGLSAAALAMVPTILGWAWMLGVMAVAGLPFDPANIVSLPLVLGIGVAYGVHMVHRARGEAAAGTPVSLDPIVRGTGGAVVVAALTTMVGFGSLVVVDYGAMKSFGTVMVLGIAGCLIAALVVLPATLVILRRAK